MTTTRLKVSRFERITNLALTLMSVQQPVTLQQLVSAIPGYPTLADEATVRMAFERDKRILRNQHLAIVTSDAPVATHLGYALSNERTVDVLPISFSLDEQSELVAALSTFRFEDDHARSAILKLAGGLSTEQLAAIVDKDPAHLVRVALASRRPLRLIYNNRTCDVEPYGLVEQLGTAVLVGRDQHLTGTRLRSYPLERISMVVLGPQDHFQPPRQFDPSRNGAPLFDPFDDSLETVVNRAIDAGARFGRLMSVLSYLATANTVRTSHLAHLLQVRVAELTSELEAAACCGVAPYTPDRLLDITVDSDAVAGYGLDEFRRSPLLTADEAVAAARAGRSLLSIHSATDQRVLESAIAKCEQGTGVIIREEPAPVKTWPGEWATLVRMRIAHLPDHLRNFIVDEPKELESGAYDVTAFLADRRWQQTLLATLDDSGALLSLEHDRQSLRTFDRRSVA